MNDLAARWPSWAGFRKKIHSLREHLRCVLEKNMKHLIVASPSAVSTTLLPQKKKFTQNPFFTTTNKQGPALLSPLLHPPRRRFPPAVRRHKRHREYLMLSKPSGSCEGPDDSARHMCRDGERCCVIVWRGCWQSVVPPHGATVRHSPDPSDPASHLPPHPPPPFFRLRVKHLLPSFCLSLPSPTSVFSLKGFFFFFFSR